MSDHPYYDALVEARGVADIAEPMLSAYKHWAWYGVPPDDWAVRMTNKRGGALYVLTRSEDETGVAYTVNCPELPPDFLWRWHAETHDHVAWRAPPPFEVPKRRSDRRLLLLCGKG